MLRRLKERYTLWRVRRQMVLLTRLIFQQMLDQTTDYGAGVVTVVLADGSEDIKIEMDIVIRT